MTTTTLDTAQEPTVEAITAVPLTLADRCCACASGTSQAFVRVNLVADTGRRSELLFCGHHYNKHEAALAGRASVLSVQDEREKINEKPSLSSA